MSNEIQGIHLTTDPKGTGWVNQSNGVILSRHNTKNVAAMEGRAMAKRHGAQYTIHRIDGTVIESRTYAVSPLE